MLVEPATVADVWGIPLRPRERALPDVRNYCARRLDCSAAITVFHGEHIVAVIGLAYEAPHMAELWAMLSPLAPKYPHTVVRSARTLMQSAFAGDSDLTRVHATVKAGDEAAARAVRLVGLKHEATLARAYVDGSDVEVFTCLR